jgi:CheY-like chemotaxis protein
VSAVTTVEASAGDAAPLRVLIVDNRSDRRELMRHVVVGTGLAAPEIAEAGTAAEATAMLDGSASDVVLLEIQLPVTLGPETIAALRRHSPRSRIVVCLFHRDDATEARAQAEGADAYLDQPISSRSL